MKFRFHRGGFAESMATVCDVTTEKEFKGLVGDGVIKFIHYAYDERNKWDTYLVEINGKIAGFSDSNKFEKTKPPE